MPKANVAQFSFASGEISPRLRGRADTAKYAAGAETVENFIVTPHGSLMRRPGFKYLGNAVGHNQNKQSRLFPFRFSNTETYILEFAPSVIRIWRNDALLTTSANQYQISTVAVSGAATTTTITTTAVHAYNGQSVTVYIKGVSGYTSVNEYFGPATGTSAFQFALPKLYVGGVAGSGTIDVLSSTPIEVATPYTNGDFEKLYIAQSADVVYICHPYYQPRKLTRTSLFSWALSTFDNVDGPYMPLDTRNITMTLSGVTDTATLKASSGTPFVAGDVGEYVEYNELGTWKLALITAFTDTSTVTVDIIGNTLVDLDPEIVLTPKTANTARAPEFQNARRKITQLEKELADLKRIRGQRGGFNVKNPTSEVVKDGIDPTVTITDPGGGAGTTITSSHSGTFSRNDVGKYLRTGRELWRQITTFTNDKSVVCGAQLTFMAATPAAETLYIVPNSRSITATLTASAAAFASSDVGRHVRLNFSSTWIWCKITAYTSSTVVTVALYDEPPTNPIDNGQLINNGRSNLWRLGAWSDTTGWPHCATFHEQRLVFAATNSEPQSIWMSISGDFENFAPTEPDSSVLDDNGVSYTLASNEVNKVCWLHSGAVLLIGTVGGEWQLRAASSIQDPITPSNIVATPQTAYGSVDNARAVRIGSSVLFIQRSGTKLIELSYSFELDSWVGRDLTLPSDHILKGSDGTATAVELAWAPEPYNLLWIRLTDGSLACVTYNKDQDITAWHKHTLGGNQTKVTSVAVCPTHDTNSYRLYITTTAGGVYPYIGAQYVMRLNVDDTFYADAYEDVNLTGVTSITVAPRFSNGDTCDVNASRTSWIGNFTVSGGAISLGGTHNVDYYGWNYTSKVKFLPPEGGSLFGTAQGKTKRSAIGAVRVYDSVSFKHGKDSSPVKEETFSSTPFTGDHRFNLDQTYDLEGVYYITQGKSLSLNLLAWLPQVNTNE